MPTQISWNRQIPCATGQNLSVFKQTQQLDHGRVTTEDHWVGRLDADTWWSETLFLRYSWVTKRLIHVLFSMLRMRAGMTVWCTLIHSHCHWCLCPTACSKQKLDFEKVLHEKGKRREHSMQIYPGNVNHCFRRKSPLIGVNSITGYDKISAFFGKGKWKTVQLFQPMEGTPALWQVPHERVISIPL